MSRSTKFLEVAKHFAFFIISFVLAAWIWGAALLPPFHMDQKEFFKLGTVIFFLYEAFTHCVHKWYKAQEQAPLEGGADARHRSKENLWDIPRDLRAVIYWVAKRTPAYGALLCSVWIPMWLGTCSPLQHLGATRRPLILITGDNRVGGFAGQIKEYLETDRALSGPAHSTVCDVKYFRIEDPVNMPRRNLPVYEGKLNTRFAEELASNFPHAILSADSSSTISYLSDLAKKVAAPTIVVCATKGGVVSYKDNIVRWLPPNLAQAVALDAKRQYILRKVLLPPRVDAQEALTHPQPKVLFGFVHDNTPFSVDLKDDYFALQGLAAGPEEAAYSGTLVFNCQDESQINDALQVGKDKKVTHWFVALYVKRAQDFHRAKSALESGVSNSKRASVTYCDSAYGKWLFGATRYNTDVALPVYSETSLKEAPHPLFADESKTGTRLFNEPLHTYAPCYGPFARDALYQVLNEWDRFLDKPQATFSSYFFQNVVKKGRDGVPLRPTEAASLKAGMVFYGHENPPEQETDDVDQPAIRARREALEKTVLKFHLFGITDSQAH